MELGLNSEEIASILHKKANLFGENIFAPFQFFLLSDIEENALEGLVRKKSSAENKELISAFAGLGAIGAATSLLLVPEPTSKGVAVLLFKEGLLFLGVYYSINASGRYKESFQIQKMTEQEIKNRMISSFNSALSQTSAKLQIGKIVDIEFQAINNASAIKSVTTESGCGGSCYFVPSFDSVHGLYFHTKSQFAEGYRVLNLVSGQMQSANDYEDRLIFDFLARHLITTHTLSAVRDNKFFGDASLSDVFKKRIKRISNIPLLVFTDPSLRFNSAWTPRDEINAMYEKALQKSIVELGIIGGRHFRESPQWEAWVQEFEKWNSEYRQLVRGYVLQDRLSTKQEIEALIKMYKFLGRLNERRAQFSRKGRS